MTVTAMDGREQSDSSDSSPRSPKQQQSCSITAAVLSDEVVGQPDCFLRLMVVSAKVLSRFQ